MWAVLVKSEPVAVLSTSWNIRLDLFQPFPSNHSCHTHTAPTHICIELPYLSGSWVRGSVPLRLEIKELLVLEQLWENKYSTRVITGWGALKLAACCSHRAHVPPNQCGCNSPLACVPAQIPLTIRLQSCQSLWRLNVERRDESKSGGSCETTRNWKQPGPEA